MLTIVAMVEIVVDVVVVLVVLAVVEIVAVFAVVTSVVAVKVVVCDTGGFGASLTTGLGTVGALVTMPDFTDFVVDFTEVVFDCVGLAAGVLVAVAFDIVAFAGVAFDTLVLLVVAAVLIADFKGLLAVHTGDFL